jgi:hypothetical protein
MVGADLTDPAEPCPGPNGLGAAPILLSITRQLAATLVMGAQLGFMFTLAQSAKPVNPPGTKARVAAMRFSRSGPK